MLLPRRIPSLSISAVLSVALFLAYGGAVWAQSGSRVSVSIDLSAISDQHYRSWDIVALEQRLTVRLVQGGFAVVPLKTTPTIRLVLSVEKGALHVGGSLSPSKKTRRRQINRGTGQLKDTHLEIVHKSVALVRELANDLPKQAASRPTSQPTSQPASSPAQSQPTGKSPAGKAVETVFFAAAQANKTTVEIEPWHFDVGFSASWLYRIERHDSQFGLLFRAQKKPWVMTGSFFFAPASVDELHVFEWGAEIGAARHIQLASSLSLDLGVQIGLLHHHYSLHLKNDTAGTSGAAGTTGDSGDRIAFLASLKGRLIWHLDERVAASVWVAPGLTSQSRTHRVDGVPVWMHSEFRLESGITLLIRVF
jgi:hypothetical protein